MSKSGINAAYLYPELIKLIKKCSLYGKNPSAQCRAQGYTNTSTLHGSHRATRQKDSEKFGILSDQVKNKAGQTQAGEASTGAQVVLFCTRCVISLVRGLFVSAAFCCSMWHELIFVKWINKTTALFISPLTVVPCILCLWNIMIYIHVMIKGAIREHSRCISSSVKYK